MLALIMAGGVGSRLNLGEKPLVVINGVPMIGHVLSVFEEGNYETVVVTSPRTPVTANWARVNGYECIRTSGNGYINDLFEAVTILDEKNPLFTSVADIPCITGEIIKDVRVIYELSGSEALSVWLPVPGEGSASERPYVECIEGQLVFPAGLNIIRGDLIDRPQEEKRVILDDPRLIHNVNTREDLENARKFLSLQKSVADS